MKFYLSSATIFSALLLCTLQAHSAVGNTPIICQNQKCFPATDIENKDDLFIQIHNMFKKASNNSLAICEANPISKACINKGISFPITAQYMQNTVDISGAKLIDVQKIDGSSGLDLIIDYKIKAGDIFPNCQTAPSRLGVLQKNTVQIVSPEFSCHLTQSTPTPISIVYHVDYIDLTNKIIGAYYAASAGQTYFGNNKTGYLTLHLQRETPVNITIPQNIPTSDMGVNFSNTQPHTQMSPIWMKPTPFLNLETPTYVDQDCMHTPQGCAQLMLETPSSVSLTPNTVNSDVPSTTGLINQDKTILPPVKGVRKTVKIKKQVFENGKQISVEEDVQQYIQDTPEEEFINQKQKEINALKLQIPDMPKPIHQIEPLPIDNMPFQTEYTSEPAIVLSANEIAQIERETGYPISHSNQIQNQSIPIIVESKNTAKKEPVKEKPKESLFEKIEKYLYF